MWSCGLSHSRKLLSFPGSLPRMQEVDMLINSICFSPVNLCFSTRDSAGSLEGLRGNYFSSSTCLRVCGVFHSVLPALLWAQRSSQNISEPRLQCSTPPPLRRALKATGCRSHQDGERERELHVNERKSSGQEMHSRTAAPSLSSWPLMCYVTTTISQHLKMARWLMATFTLTELQNRFIFSI